ncbi:MAG TPA: hypothetical protein EYH05_17530, partial [Anaerolineae bacterium]|nr:hypothetical protein [Anaerolineae bacterium]
SVEWMTRQIVREFDETHDDIRVTQHLDIRSSQQASQQAKAAFYYILTEALNNVDKHAQATRVDVTLCYDEAGLTLEVRDNGVGADVVTRPLTELLRGHHMGVADMHRWASIGGGEVGDRAEFAFRHDCQIEAAFNDNRKSVKHISVTWFPGPVSCRAFCV